MMRIFPKLLTITTLLVAALSFLRTANGAEDNEAQTIFVCRSPLLAFDFWSKTQDLRRQGVEVDRKILQQLCDGMHAGNSPQCLAVRFTSIKPVASGWGGALALANEGQRIWFHQPDSGGWVHPNYYIWLVNRPKSENR